jgi:hypothetical protein
MKVNPLRFVVHYITNLRTRAKQLVLFFAGICVVVAFFILPPYKDWANDRIIAYYREFGWQKSKMGIQQRMASRFEGSYTYSRQIASFFEKKKNKPSALVLVPPTDYFKQYGIDFHVPEPAVFYYYTGLKTLWPNSINAAAANWYVHVNNGEIVIDSVVDRRNFNDTLAALKKYNPSL